MNETGYQEEESDLEDRWSKVKEIHLKSCENVLVEKNVKGKSGYLKQPGKQIEERKLLKTRVTSARTRQESQVVREEYGRKKREVNAPEEIRGK